MTTDTHDTAAALWSAIDAYGCDAASHGALGKDTTTRAAIDRAITAHVEAEVARRLEAAPEVEAAIAKYGVQAAGGADTTSSESTLRAAIAADKARAVEALKSGMRRVYKCSAHEIDPTKAWGCPDCLAELRRARPTPDEARRLVEAHRNAAADVARCGALHASGPGTEELQAECDAEAALLRTLGVE